MKGYNLIFMTALISGFSIFFNKFALVSFDPALYVLLKNSLVALILLLIVVGLNNASLKQLSSKDWKTLVLIGLVGGSVPFILFFKGLSMTSGPAGAFIHKLMFVFVAIFALVFLKDKASTNKSLSLKILIPASLLIVGNAMMLKFAFIDSFAGFFSGIANGNIGLLLILAATLFWSAETIISKKALRRIEPNVVAFGRMFFGSIFVLAYIIMSRKTPLISTIHINFWMIVVMLMLLAYVLTWYNGLKHANVVNATAILLLGSPITLLLSMFFLDSALTVLQLFGMVAVSLGVVLILKSSVVSEPLKLR